MDLTNELIKDIILRKVIKKQTERKIADETGCSVGTIHRLIKAYELIEAKNYKGLEEFAQTYTNGYAAACRRIEDALDMAIPNAIWDKMNATAREAEQATSTVEKKSEPEKNLNLPDNTALVIAQILAKLDTLICGMSDMQKTMIASAEANANLLKNIGLEVGELPSNDILHALTEKITDCINANADVNVQERHKEMNALACAVKKLR